MYILEVIAVLLAVMVLGVWASLGVCAWLVSKDRL